MCTAEEITILIKYSPKREKEQECEKYKGSIKKYKGTRVECESVRTIVISMLITY